MKFRILQKNVGISPSHPAEQSVHCCYSTGNPEVQNARGWVFIKKEGLLSSLMRGKLPDWAVPPVSLLVRASWWMASSLEARVTQRPYLLL